MSDPIENAEQEVLKNTSLGPTGFRLRELMSEGGIEVTPDELHIALAEAAVRIGHGKCEFCGQDDKELRYGMCFDCFSAED